MIVINKTLHGINLEKKVLIPGTNVIDAGDLDVKHPVIAAMIAEGQLVVRENLDNLGDAAEAIANANTAAALEAVEGSVKEKSDVVKKAVDKRKKDLDDFDKKVAEGIQKAKGKKA